MDSLSKFKEINAFFGKKTKDEAIKRRKINVEF